MANWTDNRPPVFNPYVQQLPVEAMTQVGVEKQKRYDEGVQKIQTEVDNIAGLDIIRDVDKNYLQSKLNQLGTNLKSVTAADFSNFQLVNSVGGMANQIAKDRNILNAVSSTARFRKEQAFGETLKKEGKSSVNREYDFNKSVNDWLNNTDLNASFNGQYKEHIDVNKKVLEIIGKINPNAKQEDLVNAVRSDGTINYKQMADVMQRRGITEVSEGQIKTAVNSMLDANDMDELYSQGRYAYKDYTPAALQAESTRTYELGKRSYQSKLEELQRQLLVTTDITQQHDINDTIEYYKTLLGDSKNNIPSLLEKTHNSILENIMTNPDEARSSLYTRNWLDEIANGFAHREIKDEVLASPYKENEWKRLAYNLDLLQESHLQSYRNAQLEIDKERLGIDRDKLALEREKLSPGIPYYKRTGDASTQEQESLKNFANYNNELKTRNETILNEYADSRSSMDTKVKPSDILRNIELYKSNKYTPKTKDEEVDFNEYIKNSNLLATQSRILAKKTDEAYREVTGGIAQRDLLSSQLKGKADIDIVKDGINYHFTPKEIYDYISKEEKYTKSYNMYGGGYSMSPGSKLSDKERVLANEIEGRYSGSTKAINTQLNEYLNSYSSIAKQTRDIDLQVTKRVSEKMKDITGIFATEQAAVHFKDTDEEKNFIRDLTTIVQADMGAKSGALGYDTEKSLDFLTKTGGTDVEAQHVRQGDKNFIQLTNKKSKKTELIPVTPEFVLRNKNLGEKYLNKNLDFAMVLLTNNGSTNIFKDYDNAYYNSGLFGGYDVKGKRTVKMPIVADLERGRSGAFYPVLKRKTKDGKIEVLPYPHATTKEEFEAWLPTLTDEKIEMLFNDNKKNTNQ